MNCAFRCGISDGRKSVCTDKRSSLWGCPSRSCNPVILQGLFSFRKNLFFSTVGIIACSTPFYMFLSNVYKNYSIQKKFCKCFSFRKTPFCSGKTFFRFRNSGICGYNNYLQIPYFAVRNEKREAQTGSLRIALRVFYIMYLLRAAQSSFGIFHALWSVCSSS